MVLVGPAVPFGHASIARVPAGDGYATRLASPPTNVHCESGGAGVFDAGRGLFLRGAFGRYVEDEVCEGYDHRRIGAE